jgi:hypothetical protein
MSLRAHTLLAHARLWRALAPSGGCASGAALLAVRDIAASIISAGC